MITSVVGECMLQNSLTARIRKRIRPMIIKSLASIARKDLIKLEL